MSRYKHYLEIDVVQAARERMRHTYETFDSVLVNFSGGKDSLTVLHLAREAAAEFGQKKVLVAFRDEEIIPQSVVEFVDHYRRQPWVEMQWYAVPFTNQKYILGKTIDCVLWDPSREWFRPKPPWANTRNDTRTIHDVPTADKMQAEGLPGRIAFVTGVRAAESLIRYRSCVEKLNESYICSGTQPNIKMVKPIYDWEENDVFKFLHDSGIPWCPHYDAQHLVPGSAMRVSPPTHAQAAKKMDLLRAIDPDWYQRLVTIFPELTLQERYYKDFDRDRLTRHYGDSWESIKEWIDENLTGSDYAFAMKRYRDTRIRAENDPEAYPLKEVLKYFAAGSYLKEFLPRRKRA